MDDSSSQSPMEDGSIDGSEHEYDEYDADGPDDEPEDEYDDTPDDDEEDMDDDDDISTQYEVPPNLEDVMHGIVSHLRVVDRHDFPDYRIEELHSGNRAFGLVALDASGPPSQFGTDDAVRSMLLDPFDGLPPSSVHGRGGFLARSAAALAARSGALHFPSLSQMPNIIPMSVRSRGSLFSPDVFRQSDSLERVHPALHRPETPSSFGNSTTGRSDTGINLEYLLSRMHASASSSRISTIATINLDLARPPIDASRALQNTETAFDNALSSVQMLSQLVSPSALEPIMRPSTADQANGPRQGDQGAGHSVPPQVTQSNQAQNARNDDQVQPVHPTTVGDQQERQFLNRRASATSSGARQLSIVASPLERVSHGGTSSAIPRWVQPLLDSDQFNVLSTVGRIQAMHDTNSFMRRPLGGRIPRERDRASSTRRWTYDPPGNGGDDLPPIFGGESSGQRGQHAPNVERRSATNSFAIVAAESFEPVDKLETKIVSRLAALAHQLRKIDDNMNKGITDVKKRKEKEEKKLAEKASKPSATRAGKKPKSPAILPGVDELSEIAERALNDIAGLPGSNHEVSSSATVRGGASSQVNEVAASDLVAAAAGEDDIMQSAGESEAPALDVELGDGSTGSNDVAEPPVSIAGDGATGAVQSAQQPSGATNPENYSPNSTPVEPEFATVAAARAAAIGISLDAPANNDPNVLRAAVESTGIDPTFLAALPDDVRADVLNDHFQRIRSSAPPASQAAHAPATTLNQDFLIALPPELRAEVLEAEAEYEARNSGGVNAPSSAAGGSSGAGAGTGGNAAGANAPAGEDMDTASFFATLAPDLREEILLTVTDSLLSSLPPAVAAEARALRERDAANRMQHQAWSGPGDEAPVLFRREMYNNGMSMFRREREARDGRREPAGMRWENIEAKWRRVGPKDEDEIKSTLDDDALSSIVQLLRWRQSTFGKTVMYQVLGSACKNRKAREKVLTELLSMITGNDEIGASSSGVFASQGTVVRRALELLVQLCKNDQTVAESMIGLGSSLPSLPRQECIIDEIEAVNGAGTKNILCLSTLTSLLTSPLFTRSNTHLEQLLVLISVVCQAFPPSRAGKTKRRKPPVPSALDTLLSRQETLDVEGDGDDDDEDVEEARRAFLEQMEEAVHARDERDLTGEESVEAAQQLGALADFRLREIFDRPRTRRIPPTEGAAAHESSDSSDGDREGDELRIVIDQSGDAVLEETLADRDDQPAGGDNAAANTVPANSEGNSAALAGEDKPKKKKEKKQDVHIPVEYRVPKLSEADLNALVVVLRRAGCTDWAYDRVSTALGQLGELPSNRAVTVAALAKSAQDLGLQVKKTFAVFKDELESCAANAHTAALRRKQLVSKFAMASYSSELTLLRLVKTASALLNQTGKRDKFPKMPGELASTNVEDTKLDPKVIAELRENKELVFRGLQDLWTGLNEVLDLIETELEHPGKTKGAQIPGTGYPSGGRTEGLARLARNRSSRKSLSPVLARLSPVIEAFFIAHSALIENGNGVAKDKVVSPVPASPRDSVPSPSPAENIDSKDAMVATKELGRFIERHRVPVNALLRSNPALLETSFNMALKHPHAIDFDNKKAYFRNLIKKRSSEAHAGTRTLRLQIRRDRVFDDSFLNLRGKSKEEMKGRLHVQFIGEEGIDAGGVTREWYTILARQIFDANYALFCRSAAKAATYQPDKRSYINSEHLENFKFVGRVIAKAIYDGQLIDAYFTRSFYKHILGIKPTYHDIEAQDPDYYNSLKWILENDITGVLDHTMSAEYEEFGQHTIVDLMSNGRNIPVTEENKAEYVRLVTEVRLTKAIEKQIEAFKKGFHELIPLEDCKIFNELELELLMSGLPDIDMADLKANVEYTGYTSSSPQINWFWRCVGQMDQEDLARLVMFVTGTSKVPLEGFSALQGMNGAQKFQIHRVAGDTQRLPSAHTCFNQLDLPEYSSAELLSERLLRAVRECNVGFGFA